MSSPFNGNQINAKVIELCEEAKALTPDERSELFGLFLDDPKLREDVLDIALMLEAEAEGGESVTFDELLAGTKPKGRHEDANRVLSVIYIDKASSASTRVCFIEE